jgi:hypothetical protein
MWGYPEMSIKIIDVPRMGYSAYEAKGFESYEISTRASLFVPVDYFADLTVRAVTS